MSIEPQHRPGAPSTDLRATLDDFTARGWTVRSHPARGHEIAVVAGAMGILVVGDRAAGAADLHARAAHVCAVLPARLRRHVHVVDPAARARLAAMPAVLTNDQVGLAAAALTSSAGDGLTVTEVLEWTRHARPEPARTVRISRLAGPASWLTRHALVFAVIAVGVAMLSVLGMGQATGGGGPRHHPQDASRAQAITMSIPHAPLADDAPALRTGP